jgi:hypothetical protein
MANVFHRASGAYLLSVNTPDYPPEQWLINPVLPDGVPWKHLKVVGDSVVEMTDQEKALVDNPPESMADRHLREQREGVELVNGWHLKYDKDSRAMMNDLKSLIDLAGGQIPGVSFWEANGTKHDVTVQQGTAILTEYAVKSAVEVMRQFSEVSGG